MDAQRHGVLLDLDGTLVDSVYLHVVTWVEAFRAAGHDVQHARAHAGVGMGSDRYVPWVLGHRDADVDALSEAHRKRFLDRADGLRPTPGAADLLSDLEGRGVPFVIATSASPPEREALLAALGREDVPVTDAGDVSSPKPAPDLLLAACEQLGIAPERATMVGDSPWDAEAAQRVGARAIGVRCGGFPDAALRGAGAIDVVDDPRALLGRL